MRLTAACWSEKVHLVDLDRPYNRNHSRVRDWPTTGDLVLCGMVVRAGFGIYEVAQADCSRCLGALHRFENPRVVEAEPRERLRDGELR